MSADEQAMAHPANPRGGGGRRVVHPQRWSVNDALLAVAAVVLVGSILGPWFRATVKFKTSPLVGYLMEPKGSESSIEAHRFLLAVGALALVQLAVLIAQNAPDRHAVPIVAALRYGIATTRAMWHLPLSEKTVYLFTVSALTATGPSSTDSSHQSPPPESFP